MEYEKRGFKDAYEKLCQRAGFGGVTHGSEGSPQKKSGLNRGDMLRRAAEVYHQAMCEVKRGVNYLAGRGFKDEELLKRHKIGFVDGRLKRMLPEEEAHQAAQALKEAGLLNEKGNERFYNCVVFPVYDRNGAVVNFYGRNVNPESGVKHLYLPGPRQSVWNWQAFKAFREVVLTESIMDALSLQELGIHNVAALYGVEGLSEDHLQFMRDCRTERMLVCLDNDEAGQSARKRIRERIEQTGAQVRDVFLPEKYKDVNDALQKGMSAEECKGYFLQSAEKNDARIIVSVPSKAEAASGGAVIASAVHDGRGRGKAEEREDGIYFEFEKRRYRVRGLTANNWEHMRVTVKAETKSSKDGNEGENGACHLDTLDLYSSKSRSVFVGQCRKIFKAEEGEMEGELNRMIAELERARLQLGEDKEPQERAKMSAEEEREALAALKSPTLLADILEEMDEVGYVGEEANKAIGYLVGISRKLDDPLSCVINSQSGAGKSVLAETIERLTPPEDVVMYSRLTMLALFYMERTGLKGKLLIIEERQGAENADYSIRTLQSKKKLVQAVPMKDPSTGKIKTMTFEVEGPVAYIETTTRPRINEENATRCIELYLDESREQTERIQKLQKESKTLGGLKKKERAERIIKRHHNMQRLLKKVKVVNPYAEELEFPAQWLRTRRDNLRFLNLIEGVTFLYQHQRSLKKFDESADSAEYIESTVEDYQTAYSLAKEVMGESLTELKKPQRELLKQVEELLKDRVETTRRQIREKSGIPDTRLRELLNDLVSLEYLQAVEGKQGKGYRYQLRERSIGAEKIVMGLTTPEELVRKLQSRLASA